MSSEKFSESMNRGEKIFCESGAIEKSLKIAKKVGVFRVFCAAGDARQKLGLKAGEPNKEADRLNQGGIIAVRNGRDSGDPIPCPKPYFMCRQGYLAGAIEEAGKLGGAQLYRVVWVGKCDYTFRSSSLNNRNLLK